MKTLPKIKRPILRYGARVRVTDLDSFYYGLTGTLSSLDPELPLVFIELDVEAEDDDTEAHPVHMDTVSLLGEDDPDYDGVEFEEEEDEEEEELVDGEIG